MTEFLFAHRVTENIFCAIQQRVVVVQVDHGICHLHSCFMG